MKRMLLMMAVLAAGSTFAETEVEMAFGEAYVGLSGSMLLPQGGSRMHRVGGAALRGGYYLTEACSVEGEVAWLEKQAGLGVDLLCHWRGWEVYDSFFGFSRFDPFFTFGAKGWVGAGDGQVGPKVGTGALFYLTDEWAIRADADATLGLDSDREMLYSLSVGVQYSF